LEDLRITEDGLERRRKASRQAIDTAKEKTLEDHVETQDALEKSRKAQKDAVGAGELQIKQSDELRARAEQHLKEAEQARDRVSFF